MFGLLGDGFEDPRSAAIMGIAAGLRKKDLIGGLLAGNQAYGEAKQGLLKQKYVDMQMQNMQSEIEQRKAAIEQKKRDEELFQSIFSQKPPAQMGQLGSGSFGIMPAAPGVPPIPQAGGSIVPNLSFDQLAMLKRRGLDLTEIHKYANDPLKLEAGATYRNRVTGREEFMPRLPEGMAPQGGGQYGFVPGYQTSVAELEGAKTRAIEGVKAENDLVQVAAPDGSMRWVPRSQALSSARQPAPMTPPRPAATVATPAAAGQPVGAYVGDQQVVLAAINEIKDPVERQRARQAWEQQNSPLQATPTTAQAAAREGAIASAKLPAQAGDRVNDSWVKNSYEPTLASGNTARDLLDTVQVTRQAMQNLGGTGWGTQAKAAAAAVLNGLGVAPDNAKMFAANAEVFQKTAMDRLWTTLNEAKGPQTEGDADRASKTYASLKNTTAANDFILDFAEAKAQRDQIKARFYQQAMPIAKNKGDLAEVDREWAKRAPSIFNMPSMARWGKGIK